jgi:hypothetical protein
VQLSTDIHIINVDLPPVPDIDINLPPIATGLCIDDKIKLPPMIFITPNLADMPSFITVDWGTPPIIGCEITIS